MEVWTAAIEALEGKIGYCFHNKKLIGQALTHSSFANEQKINRLQNYERIEFLGDAVLELAVSLYFYENFPEMSEGRMTKLRAATVCEPTLAHCSRTIDLGRLILLGRGEEQTGGRERDSILADVLEAVIGAIYLDGGLAAATEFIRRFVLADLGEKQLFLDSKTMLQEYVQQRGLGKLRYELIAETGPEHHKEFHVELYLNADKIGAGVGKNKKAAEQQAAYRALPSVKSVKSDSKP